MVFFKSLQNQKFIESAHIIVEMDRRCSILKDKQQNVDTKSTNTDEHNTNNKWLQPTSQSEAVHHFHQLQMSILNLFTQVKKKLTNIYNTITSHIKSISGSLLNQQCKIDPKFLFNITQIQDEIADKLSYLDANMQNMLLSSQSLASLSVLVLEKPKKLISRRRIASSRSIKNIRGKSETLTTVANICGEDYRNTVKIALTDKRCDNMSWLSGIWESLESLILDNKNIYAIVPLRTINADKLKQISITSNEIMGLEFMKGAYFPHLIKLNLKNNIITKINGIQQANFPSLKFLNLSFNKIKQIDPLIQTYFPNLLELSLASNRLETVAQLAICQYPHLEVLNIDKNSIGDINFVSETQLKRLKILSFCHNKVQSIDFLRKCSLPCLEGFLAYNNKIKSINVLEDCDFPKLKQLMLNNNQIQDISIVCKLKYPQLTEFDLENNKIKRDEMCCLVTKTRSLTMAKKRYPFIQI